jgi:hypothetical protein
MGLVDVTALSASDRFKSKHRENVYEPRAVGMGAALEEENEEKILEIKRKQVCTYSY